MKTTRHILFTLLIVLCCTHVNAQTSPDSPLQDKKSPSVTQSADTTGPKTDSLLTRVQPVTKSYYSIIDSLLSANRYVNTKMPPVLFLVEERHWNGKEFTFYALCLLILIFGMFKTFYSSYFKNLIRVFFNTSIRQTQLTEQLKQATLPSLILNIFFSISTGFYIWLLFKHYHPPRIFNSGLLLPFCMAGIGILYFMKFCILKFIGWMSGMQEAADSYIFVIFLVNKITGIILVPFIVLLAFSYPSWIDPVALLSALILGILFISRYVKTYGVLQYQFPMQPFHFLIFIVAMEIIPLLILYKIVVDYVI